VLDETQLPSPKGAQPPIFGPYPLWPNGWMDQDATWYGGRRHATLSRDIVTRHCVRWGPRSPYAKRGRSPQFSAHVYYGQTTGWIKMPLGKEVDLSPGHILLDGDPAASPRKGHSSTPVFSAHVYCGHGRPSQLGLLLSPCISYSIVWRRA